MAEDDAEIAERIIDTSAPREASPPFRQPSVGAAFRQVDAKGTGEHLGMTCPLIPGMERDLSKPPTPPSTPL